MLRNRKVLFLVVGVFFLAVVAFGTLLAINRKSVPPLLVGIDARIVNKESAFFAEPAGRMRQMTATTLVGVDRQKLQSRLLEQQKRFPGTVAFFFPDGEQTILVEVGDVKPLDYFLSYVTTAGRPPKSTGAFSVAGGASVHVTSTGKGAFVISAIPKKKP